MFRFGTNQGWDGYGTTHNTSLTFSVNLNGTNSNKFESSGTITITVTKGGDNFTALNSHPGDVTITLSGGSIRKCVEGQAQPFTSGTNEKLNKGTKLEIQAKGTLSANGAPLTGSEVTIKGTVNVNSDRQSLGKDALTLLPDSEKDHSSTGLGGSITPQSPSDSGPVTIGTDSNINLTLNALEALLSLTKNAVTLSGSGSGSFRSSASITVTRTSGNANFKTLQLTGENLQITLNSGSIKKLDSEGKLIDLTTKDTLPVNTKLSLNATGVSGTPPVTLTGTIVVTSNNKQIGTDLTFDGGPNGTGVSGSLALNTSGTITAGSLEITPTAYTAIKEAYDTTSSSFTIGAADPRDPTGTGVNQDDFNKYWHLLPANNYTDKDIPYPTSIFPALIVLVATIFPPMIVVILQITDKTSPTKHSPKFYKGWGEHSLSYWHIVDVLIVTKITLATIFIYSLHYRDSLDCSLWLL